jgi:hypothetical protein
LRATVAKIDALCAAGLSLDDACKQADATPRSYRRWAEILSFSRTEPEDTGGDGIAAPCGEFDLPRRVRVGPHPAGSRVGDEP